MCPRRLGTMSFTTRFTPTQQESTAMTTRTSKLRLVSLGGGGWCLMILNFKFSFQTSKIFMAFVLIFMDRVSSEVRAGWGTLRRNRWNLTNSTRKCVGHQPNPQHRFYIQSVHARYVIIMEKIWFYPFEDKLINHCCFVPWSLVLILYYWREIFVFFIFWLSNGTKLIIGGICLFIQCSCIFALCR